MSGSQKPESRVLHATRNGFEAVRLTVSPAVRDPNRVPRRLMFEARLEDRLLCTSATPLCDAARILLAEGCHPEAKIVMTHAESDVVSLHSTVGVAAGLTVQEAGAPRFAKWQPNPWSVT
jgi:hypothetical protein